MGELSWVDLEAILENTRTVLIAVGSTEQHGPHLPLLSDTYQGEEYIRRTVSALALRGITICPGFSIPFAPAEDSMSFPGTLSLTNGTYEALVKELLDSLARHGFRKFPILICHEQNMGPVMAMVRSFNAEHPDCRAAALTGWYQIPVPQMAGDTRQTGAEGHAGKLETSRMLATRPDLVRMDRAPRCHPAGQKPLPHDNYPLSGGGIYSPMYDYRSVAPEGVIGDATGASLDRGELAYSAAIDWIAAVIERDLL